MSEPLEVKENSINGKTLISLKAPESAMISAQKFKRKQSVSEESKSDLDSDREEEKDNNNRCQSPQIIDQRHK